MTNTGLLASSPTLDGISKLINRYFYSSNWLPVPVDSKTWQIKDMGNLKIIEGYLITKKKGRYRFSKELK